MRENIGYIYIITNNINGKCYIGQTINIERRFREHKNARSKQPIHSAIRKYGHENFIFEILLECPRESTNFFEKAFISSYNSFGESGYNCSFGGDSSAGRVCSEDTRTKISVANTGRKHPSRTQEQKENYRASKLGVKRASFSDEWKQKLSAAGKGRKQTEEHKLHIKEAKERNKVKDA